MKCCTWINDSRKYYIPELTANKEIRKIIILILKKFQAEINDPKIIIKWNNGKNRIEITCDTFRIPRVYIVNISKGRVVDAVSVDLVFPWAEELCFEYERPWEWTPIKGEKKPKFLTSKLLDWKIVEMVLKERLVALI